MTTTSEPTYVTEMRRRHRALDTAVLKMVRERGPISLMGLMRAAGTQNYETIKASLLRLQSAGRVRSEPAPAPNTHLQVWRAVERAVRE